MPDSNITKRALAQSMKTLMNARPFAKISVGDICETCGMNRKSFYYHFRDKYDLVNWVYYTEFVEALQQRQYEGTWDFLMDMCEYFYANRAFYVNALKVSGQNSFREYFGQVFQPIIYAAVEESYASSEHRAFYATFFSDAFLVSLERWLNEGAMVPKVYVRLLRTSIEGTARRVIDQLDTQDPPAVLPDSCPSGGI